MWKCHSNRVETDNRVTVIKLIEGRAKLGLDALCELVTSGDPVCRSIQDPEMKGTYTVA